jgi:hypothetical protein
MYISGGQHWQSCQPPVAAAYQGPPPRTTECFPSSFSSYSLFWYRFSYTLDMMCCISSVMLRFSFAKVSK